MRYQLRYIRAPRARRRHVRTETIVHPSMATQISPRLSNQPTAHHILAENAARASLRPRSPASAWLGAGSRGSVGERPLHTRKVAGSIPAGTTRRITRSQGYLPLGTRGRSAHSPRVIRRLSSVTVSRRARRAHPSHDEVGVVEVCVGVCGHHDRRVAHRHLQRFHVGTRRSSQRPVDMPEVVHAVGCSDARVRRSWCAGHRPFPVLIPSREPFGNVMVANVSTVAHAVRAPPRVRTRPVSITSKRAAARASLRHPHQDPQNLGQNATRTSPPLSLGHVSRRCPRRRRSAGACTEFRGLNLPPPPRP
jgi:hypothetical protein